MANMAGRGNNLGLLPKQSEGGSHLLCLVGLTYHVLRLLKPDIVAVKMETGVSGAMIQIFLRSFGNLTLSNLVAYLLDLLEIPRKPKASCLPGARINYVLDS